MPADNGEAQERARIREGNLETIAEHKRYSHPYAKKEIRK